MSQAPIPQGTGTKKPAGSEKSLSFEQKVELVRLFMEIRQPTFGVGLVGAIETRNLLSRLFPDFEAVRDTDVDELFKQYAQDLQGKYTHPDQLQLDA